MATDWTQRLRLRHLQTLLSLDQTRNISHSAQALNTTQPALSKWLRELEEDIGLTLFERHARGLRSTRYGDALIAHARRINAMLDCTRDDLAAMLDDGHGQVSIGVTAAATADTVPMAVLRMLEKLPGTQVRMVESTMDRLLQRLGDGELDIVVGRSAVAPLDEQLATHPLYVEPIHFVVRPGHPLARKRRIDWPDLMRYPWLVWPSGTPIRQHLEDSLKAARQTLPKHHLESNSITLNLTLLNHSDMVSFASGRSAHRLAQMGMLHLLPLQLKKSGAVSMYWRIDSARRMAVSAMLDALKAEVREKSKAP